MIKLGINVDHVATLRQARLGNYPDPVHAAVVAESAGADEITIHLREDRRHIQDRDLRILKEVVATSLNLEMALTEEMLQIALEVKPDSVTLVPEKREELTTEGGLDTSRNFAQFRDGTRNLQDAGIRVYLFVDPITEAVKAANRMAANGVELHTGAFADAQTVSSQKEELERITHAARLAAKIGLKVHAGHGLNLRNVTAVAAIPEITCLQIGHSIIARAVLVGLPTAVREMKTAMNIARSR